MSFLNFSKLFKRLVVFIFLSSFSSVLHAVNLSEIECIGKTFSGKKITALLYTTSSSSDQDVKITARSRFEKPAIYLTLQQRGKTTFRKKLIFENSYTNIDGEDYSNYAVYSYDDNQTSEGSFDFDIEIYADQSDAMYIDAGEWNFSFKKAACAVKRVR